MNWACIARGSAVSNYKLNNILCPNKSDEKQVSYKKRNIEQKDVNKFILKFV